MPRNFLNINKTNLTFGTSYIKVYRKVMTISSSTSTNVNTLYKALKAFIQGLEETLRLLSGIY